jgi:hypothetical protein
MINKVLSILFLTTSLLFSAITDNIVLVEDGSGSKGNINDTPVGLFLTNTDTLGGIQFEASFEYHHLELDTILTCGRCQDFDLFYNRPEPGVLAIVLVSTQGNTIQPGSDRILEVHFKVRAQADTLATDFRIDEFVFTDASAKRRSGISADGYFFIKGRSYLRIANGMDSIGIYLYNSSPVSGIQLRLEYPVSVMFVDTVRAGNRAKNLSISFNEPKNGEVIVLLYSLSGNMLNVGEGEICSIVFKNTTTDIWEPPFIELKEAVLSDTNGTTLPSETFSGNEFISRFDVTSLEESPEERLVLTGKHFQLYQNFPNPFNPTTAISYFLLADSEVNLCIYNATGQKIQTLVRENKPAGEHVVMWDASNLPSGIYFYQLTVQARAELNQRLKTKDKRPTTFKQTRKMFLMR